MEYLWTQQQAHPLEFIGLQVKLTISCGIEILVYNWLLLILPADIHGGFVSPLWFWALQFVIIALWHFILQLYSAGTCTCMKFMLTTTRGYKLNWHMARNSCLSNSQLHIIHVSYLALIGLDGLFFFFLPIILFFYSWKSYLLFFSFYLLFFYCTYYSH